MGARHSNLLIKTLLALSKIPLTRVWRNETGVARTFNGQVIRYGLKGSSDIIGLTNGRFLAVEIKIGDDKLKEEQIKFKEMVLRNGGLYFEIRSEDELEGLSKQINRDA